MSCGCIDSVSGSFVLDLLNQLPWGVLLYDHLLTPLAYNQKASEYLKGNGPLDQILAMITADTIEPHLWRQRLTTVLSNHEPFTYPPVSCCIDNTHLTLRITLYAFDTTGDTAHTIGMIVLEDVTEISALRKEMEQTTKLRTLGRLTANVAHELNGPLDGILRYVNLSIRLLKQREYDKPLEYLQHTHHGLLRMIHVISDLLDFTRNTYITTEQTSLEQMLDEAIHTVQTYMPTTHVQIRKSISCNLSMAPFQNLYQVFCNIIKNAYEAMPQGGDLHIEAFLDQKHYLNIIFHDTGQGFSPRIKDQVFTPFISTKGKGTGLGLAVCKDIVEGYKGYISTQNDIAGGARITIRLPITGIT